MPMLKGVVYKTVSGTGCVAKLEFTKAGLQVDFVVQEWF